MATSETSCSQVIPNKKLAAMNGYGHAAERGKVSLVVKNEPGIEKI
jgi:hypothetical protein